MRLLRSLDYSLNLWKWRARNGIVGTVKDSSRLATLRIFASTVAQQSKMNASNTLITAGTCLASIAANVNVLSPPT
jgi:hypothetical protein